jgi:hypothetical protein
MLKENPGEQRQFGRPRSRWTYSLKENHKNIAYEMGSELNWLRIESSGGLM